MRIRSGCPERLEELRLELAKPVRVVLLLDCLRHAGSRPPTASWLRRWIVVS